MYIHIHIYVCIYAHTYIHIHIFTHVYIYIYTDANVFKNPLIRQEDEDSEHISFQGFASATSGDEVLDNSSGREGGLGICRVRVIQGYIGLYRV